MLQKLIIFAFLLVPVMAFGQDGPSLRESGRELIINGFTVSDKVGNIDKFLSTEFRWNVMKSKDNKVSSVTFVPGVEFEYLEDSSGNNSLFFKRYSRLLWFKGYLTFRSDKNLSPYVGGAIGWDVETIKANTDDGVMSIQSNGPTVDLLTGVHFYPNRRIIVTTSMRVWRPSLNFGVGFTF